MSEYTACILSQYHWDKAFLFPRKFHFLVKTITDTVRLGVVYLPAGLCFVKFIYSFAAHITTIHDLCIYFIFKFFNLSSIPDPRFSDPDFPVNLKVLLIKIVLFFDHRSNQLFQSNRLFQAIEFVDPPVPEKLDMGFLFYRHEVLQVEWVMVKYKATHLNTYVTSDA